MAKKRLSFEEWLEEVDVRVGERFDTSLKDLEEDIPIDILRDAYEDGLTPGAFVRETVEPLFDGDLEGSEDDDGFFDDEE